MTERTPKSECTRKVEQDRSISKILTFGQHSHNSQLFLEIGRLHNFWTSNEETGPKIGMYSKNWVGQVRFENFDFLVKVKVFSLFFFFCRRFGSGSNRVDPGRSVVGGDVTDDVTALDTCGTCGGWRHPWRHRTRVARASSGGPNRRVDWRPRRRIFWRRVVARAWAFGPEIFGFCWSKAVQDPCMVSFVKF